MKKGMAVVLACLFLAGCTASLDLVPKSVMVAGMEKNYVFATGLDQNGGSMNVMDRYDDKGNLVARDASMNGGILPSLMHGAVAGAATAGGLVGAAALLRPDQVNVSQSGGGASASQSQGQAQKQKQTATGGTGGAGGAGGTGGSVNTGGGSFDGGGGIDGNNNVVNTGTVVNTGSSVIH